METSERYYYLSTYLTKLIVFKLLTYVLNYAQE